MKKSKVIIPAMALLLFSTAASITGTVAWFTSTRVFTATASQFKVGQTDGGLEATVTGGVGTHVAKSNENLSYYDKVLVDDHTNLTHGSYDHGTGTAYILNRNATSDTDYRSTMGLVGDHTTSAEGAYADETKKHNAGSDKDMWFVKQVDTDYYYVAFSWTITFKYNWAEETNDVGIYLNRKASIMQFKKADPGTEDAAQGIGDDSTYGKTAYGFRIAFGIGDNAKVWGNNNATTLNYATGEAKNSIGTYAKSYVAAGTDPVTPEVLPNYFVSETGTYAPATDATDSTTDTANKHRADRICTLAKKDWITADNNPDKGKSVISIKCVAWYEGEDLKNVISTAEMDIVDVTMSFYARSDNTRAS